MTKVLSACVAVTTLVLSYPAKAVTYCVGEGKAIYYPNHRYQWVGENYRQRWEGAPGTGEVRVYGLDSGTLYRRDTYYRENGKLMLRDQQGFTFPARRC